MYPFLQILLPASFIKTAMTTNLPLVQDGHRRYSRATKRPLVSTFFVTCSLLSLPLTVYGLVSKHQVRRTIRSVSSSSTRPASAVGLVAGAATVVSSSSMPIHDLFDSLPSRDNLLLGNVAATLARAPDFLKKTSHGILRIVEVVDPMDLAILLSIAFGTTTVFKWWNDKIVNKTIRRHAPKKFDMSRLKAISDLICQIGQCSFLAYLGEILLAFLDVVGLHFARSAPRFITVATYATWAAGRISVLKTRLLRRLFSNHPGLPRNKVLPITGVFYNRLLDIAIYLLTMIVVLDLCKVHVGVVVKSFLSVAGLSSLIFGLSLRDPATQIIQGTSLLLLDRFSPGDKIKLADGTIGRVLSIGWLDTTLAGPDNIVCRIPNSEIASKRIYNISRMKRSQVKEKLRFRYDDIDKIPALVKDIKKEIKTACSQLVVDNSRPFRVHWRGYDDDNVFIVVDTHHDIPPMTNDYYDNREKVLIAIAKAAKQNGMKFALPSKISLKEEKAHVVDLYDKANVVVIPPRNSQPNGASDDKDTTTRTGRRNGTNGEMG